MNDVDWDHVVEEIEDVGISELSAVRSFRRQLLVHLLKLHGWPDSLSAERRRNEIGLFQLEAADRFAPSMRQRLDVPAIYQQACRAVNDMSIDGKLPRPLPQTCPFTLDDLLSGARNELVALLGIGPAASLSA